LNDYATHQPVLLAALAATEGPVLECGAGHYSTPLLHAYCAPTLRSLITLEDDPTWIEAYAYLRSFWHDVDLVPDWDGLGTGQYDVAFVDHRAEARVPTMLHLRERARFIVAHDTEAACYGYAAAWPAFDWVWTFARYNTWASICGMGDPPHWLEDALSPGVAGPPKPYR